MSDEKKSWELGQGLSEYYLDPMNRVNPATEKLDHVIRKIVALPQYQPGHGGTTWCIVAAYDILTVLGYDTAALIDKEPANKGKYFTTPDEMAARAEYQAKLENYAEVCERIAQDLANLGVGVLACSYRAKADTGHIAVVAPGRYTPSVGCTVGQAGGENGVFSRKQGFGAPGDRVTFPKFYVLPHG